jgi:hypothetical protein
MVLISGVGPQGTKQMTDADRAQNEEIEAQNELAALRIQRETTLFLTRKQAIDRRIAVLERRLRPVRLDVISA